MEIVQKNVRKNFVKKNTLYTDTKLLESTTNFGR